MKGFFVKHTYNGLGRVITSSHDGFIVRFESADRDTTFDRFAFAEHDLSRALLPLGTFCDVNGRSCKIIESLPSGSDSVANEYLVEFPDGLRLSVSEVQLTVTKPPQNDPLSQLAGLSHGGYSLFAARERLVACLNSTLHDARGLRALLSSRIDLRSHQAYVAGVVILDADRRFLLADEVGLGKTIEAGIVIHDLLINKPKAKILVVCPGALTQQWLCELYSKFGGHVFTLLELHAPDRLNWPKVTKLIAPFSKAAYEHAEQLLAIPWDMVVIDEAHHLLASQSLYEFALRLSC